VRDEHGLNRPTFPADTGRVAGVRGRTWTVSQESADRGQAVGRGPDEWGDSWEPLDRHPERRRPVVWVSVHHEQEPAEPSWVTVHRILAVTRFLAASPPFRQTMGPCHHEQEPAEASWATVHRDPAVTRFLTTGAPR
jgi:hypothetical protein